MGYCPTGSKDRLELAEKGDSGLEGLKAALVSLLPCHSGALGANANAWILFTRHIVTKQCSQYTLRLAPSRRSLLAVHALTR